MHLKFAEFSQPVGLPCMHATEYLQNKGSQHCREGKGGTLLFKIPRFNNIIIVEYFEL